MVSYKNDKGKTSFNMSGTGLEITSDVMYFIYKVYDAFKSSDENAAEAFKDMVKNNIDICFNPEDALNKLADEIKDKAEDENKVDKLILKLKEINEELEEILNED